VRSGAEESRVVALRPEAGSGAAADAAVQPPAPAPEPPARTPSADERAAAAARALLAACERRVSDGSCRYALSDDARHVAGGRCACGPQELRERPVRLRGSALAQALLRMAGWRVQFDGLPARQGVIAVYPHTSNWDFVWGVLAMWAIGLPLAFWAKDSLFRVPLFGRWLRWIGGRPVDRRAAQGVVGQTAQALAEARARDEFMWLGLAPEGTRSRTAGWRSGFYHVATQAGVPLALAFIDYRRREIGLDSAWRVHGDAESDVACFAQRLGTRVGRNPDNAAPVRLL
jgi:1-acyl-sn-glycerol-3-phosphate acyltransferase